MFAVFVLKQIESSTNLRSHPQGPLEDGPPDPSQTVSGGICFFLGVWEAWRIFPGAHVGKIIEPKMGCYLQNLWE